MPPLQIAGDFGVHNTPTVSFPPGSTSRSFMVAVVDDLILENTEDFSLSLSDPSMGTVSLTQGTAVVRIMDNDGKWETHFAGPSCQQ